MLGFDNPWLVALGGACALAMLVALAWLLRRARELERERVALQADLGAAQGQLATAQEAATRASAASRESDDAAWRWLLVLDSAQVGYFDWHLDTGRAEYGAHFAAMLGYREGEIEPRVNAWERLVHPQDLDAARTSLKVHYEGRDEQAETQLRMRAAHGDWRWVRMRARVIERGEAGAPRRVLGTQVDLDALRRSEQTLAAERRLFDSGPVIVVTFDTLPPHCLLQASSNLYGVTGELHGRLAGRPLGALLHPEDSAEVTQGLAQLASRSESQIQREVRLRAPGGAWRWYMLHIVPSQTAEGHALRGYLIDIENLKQAESSAATRTAELQEVVQKMSATQRFMQSLQQITELLQLCESEEEGRLIVAQGGRELFPRWDGAISFAGNDGLMEVQASWGQFPATGHCEEADCWAVRRGRLHQASAGGTGLGLSPVCGHFGGGPLLPAQIAHSICAPLTMPGERPGALHLVAREPTSDEEARTAAWGAEALADALKLSLANLHLRMSLREQAVRDWMTGLYNRRYFDEALQHELNRAERTGELLTMALMDIDHFKSFNDSFGHEAGDEVIKAVAAQLLSFVRSYDIGCRVGGEELAVLMPRAPLGEACMRMNQLREQIGSLKLHHEGVALPRITVSIGVADTHNIGGHDLVRRADMALYTAKQSGRNRVVQWTEDLDASSAFGELAAPRLAS